MRKRSKLLVSWILGALSLSLLGVGGASAIDTWGQYDCVDTDGDNHGDTCCHNPSQSAASIYLMKVHPTEQIISNSTYRVRVRAKCNGSSTWTTGAWSSDNNCGSNCEQSSLSSCGIVAVRECMLGNQ